MTRRAPSLPTCATAMALALLPGCATKSASVAAGEVAQARQRSGEFQAAARLEQQRPPVVMDDAVPRFAKPRSVPLQPAAALPSNIGRVTLRYPGRHSLAMVAELISRLIHIPVVMTPDALASASQYAVTGTGGAGPQAGGAATGRTAGKAGANDAGKGAGKGGDTDAAVLATALGAQSAPLPVDELQNTLELNYSGTLAGLLDRVAAQAGLQWSYQKGRIVFSRVVTRAMALKALPKGLSVKGTLNVLGGGGGSEGGQGGSGSSGGSGGSGGSEGGGELAVDFETESDYWASLNDTLKSMLSAGAYVQADPRSGLVTVTDAVVNVERVEAYLNALNAQLLRQVVLELEVLQVTLSDDYAHGINWTAVLGKLDAVGENTLKFASPGLKGPLSGSAAGAVTFVLGGSDGRSPSDLMVQALQEYGKVSTSYSSVVTTTNRMPVPVGAMATQAYLRQTSPPAISATTGVTTVGSLTPGSFSTGFGMVLTPVILDSNRVLLQSVMQISSLKELKTITTGSGSLQQSLQLPNISRFVTLQRVSVQAGQTLILAGYENEHTQVDDTDMVRGLLPGSRRGGRSKQGTVVLITPRLTDH